LLVRTLTIGGCPRVLLDAKNTVTKKTTITCIKGKLTKKETGINPKCPAGYKKK
jgi:hypothetical protein